MTIINLYINPFETPWTCKLRQIFVTETQDFWCVVMHCDGKLLKLFRTFPHLTFCPHTSIPGDLPGLILYSLSLWKMLFSNKHILYFVCNLCKKKIYIFCVPCYSWLKVAPCEIRCIIWRATWRRWVTRPVRGRPMWVPIEEFRLLGPKETLMCLW